ncbi:MAG: M48 family metalloprotease, partial [Candidatus Diapherotrites archaeon]|nr:M48 family metalloprotease [Candidatus Diapherotrites archaeon]
MVGITALLSDFMLRSFLWGNNRENNRASVALIAIGLVLAILSPIIATLIQLAVSRQREYLADANSVKLTRYPDGLISALKKLDADKEPLEAANKATAHLYISDPLKNTKGMWLKGLFMTHPPISARISALEKM